MDTMNTLVINSPLWKKVIHIFVAGIFLALMIPIVVHIADTYKTKSMHVNNPNSGFFMSISPEDLRSNFLKEIFPILCIASFFILLIIILILTPRTIVTVDSEGITPFNIFKRNYKKIHWNNIERIKPISVRGTRIKTELLCIFLKDKKSKKDTGSVLKLMLTYVASIISSMDVDDGYSAGVCIPTRGLSSESIMKQIQPYMLSK